MEIGKVLQEARINKGISLKDIEEATNVRTRYLEALEDENFTIIPGEFYVKGFLRIYAKYLGLNPVQILDIYYSAGNSLKH